MIEQIDGANSAILITGDHAGNMVPDGIDLGLDAEWMDAHIAVDIGVAPLARAMAADLSCPAILATVSRLVVDLNRDPGDPAAIPVLSDGRPIPGNAALDEAGRAERIATYWQPYHDALAQRIAAHRPRLLLALHSFTPRLRARPEEARPWFVGLLHNNDARAAKIALRLFYQAGILAGDNAPYSGRLLNAAMNRHGEANGIPYLTLEVRQDLIGDATGIADWAARIVPVVRGVLAELDGGPGQ